MQLNVEFKESANHAWLVGEGVVELFIHRPIDTLQVTDGDLTCWVPSDLCQEISDDTEEAPDTIFLCCPTPLKTEIYEVLEAVTYAGGDVLMFLKPAVTIH